MTRSADRVFLFLFLPAEKIEEQGGHKGAKGTVYEVTEGHVCVPESKDFPPTPFF